MIGQFKEESNVRIDSEEGMEELKEIKINKKSKQRIDLVQYQEDGTGIGPGMYDPKLSVTKKKAPATSFGMSKTKRKGSVPKQVQQNPGPGNYNQ